MILLLSGAMIFLIGMLVGACVVRVRVTKFGERMIIEIGRQPIVKLDPITGNPLRRRWWRVA